MNEKLFFRKSRITSLATFGTDTGIRSAIMVLPTLRLRKRRKFSDSKKYMFFKTMTSKVKTVKVNLEVQRNIVSR